MTKTAAVLGAGIQGCCIALALARLGFRTRLYDKTAALYSRASVNQEGKVHLGFVYARDETQHTARTMIAHALQFAPAVEQFVGSKLDWSQHLSERFVCGIHRNSSISLQQHYAHFKMLQESFEEESAIHGNNYLGRRIAKIWQEFESTYSSTDLAHSVLTEETAIHPVWLRDVIVKAIQAHPSIEVFTGHEILNLCKRNASYQISGQNHTGVWKSESDLVINCLWEGRNTIDIQAGLTGDDNLMTRVKYGFMLRSFAELKDIPSLIITHGPFGDIVNYSKNNTLYVTWYPACMVYKSNDPHGLPVHWDDICSGLRANAQTDHVLSDTRKHMRAYLPALAELPLEQVMVGTIMGSGTSDISDPSSGLHKRHGIGVSGDGGYYSVFTGKFTSAPANAMALRAILK